MDLEEMKAGWNVLGERLAQNEILNQRIIKEMIATRTRTAYEKVYASEWQSFWIALAIALLLIPTRMFLADISMKWASFVILELTLVVAVLVQGWTIHLLSKFNLSALKVSELTRLVLKYKRLRKNNKIYGTTLGLSVVALFTVLEDVYTNVYAVTAMCVMMAFGLIISFISLKKHNRLVDEIEQGLNELEEFER